MKKHIKAFLTRGVFAAGIGPLVLAIFYLIIARAANVQTLNIEEVCIGIFSLTVLAFIAGGMNFIYQIERLPLMAAILIHGVVLYFTYLLTYLINDWLEWGIIPVVVFSIIFVIGYFIVWVIIYTVTRHNTLKINRLLKEKQGERSY